MRRPRVRLLVLAALVAGLLGTTALTAGNTVPGSRAGEDERGVGPNDLKPPQCAGITLTATVIGSGVVTGTSASELILGGSGIDTISGAGGSDCIVAGGGADIIDGGAGTDVCIGGPGIDVFTLIVIPTCETAIQ